MMLKHLVGTHVLHPIRRKIGRVQLKQTRSYCPVHVGRGLPTSHLMFSHGWSGKPTGVVESDEEKYITRFISVLIDEPTCRLLNI